MKKLSKTSEDVCAIIYKRELLCDDYYIYFPCQCVEGSFDRSDESVIDKYNCLYYGCENYSIVNTGQNLTYYYEARIDDVKNMMGVDDKTEAISKFYDKLKNNLLIGHINDSKKRIEIYELTREKLEGLTSCITYKMNDGIGSVTLNKWQIFEMLNMSEKEIKEKILELFNRTDALENLNNTKGVDSIILSPSSDLILEFKTEKKEPELKPEEKLEEEYVEDEREQLKDAVELAYEYITDRLVGQDEHVKDILSAIINNSQADTHEEIIRPFLIGGTGSGKSFLFKLIGKILDLPVIIVDCNLLVQSGYEGKSIEDALKDLYILCNKDINITNTAIVILDEIDKIGNKGATVSEIGVQQALLKFIEGQKYVINLDKTEMEKVIIDSTLMTIVACGAFEGLREKNKTAGFTAREEKQPITTDLLVEKGGMIPELLGRFNLFVEYNDVTKEMMKEELKKSKTSPIKIKEEYYLKNYGIRIVFNESYIDKICEDAIKRKSGFRGIDQIVNQSLTKVNFTLQTNPNLYKEVEVNNETIEDPKKYILK